LREAIEVETLLHLSDHVRLHTPPRLGAPNYLISKSIFSCRLPRPGDSAIRRTASSGRRLRDAAQNLVPTSFVVSDRSALG
jgi:hypothetical protein